MVRLVSETTDEERAKSAATWRFESALRQLTANLIRVTRGAGDGYRVPDQAHQLLEALDAYREAYGHWPMDAAYGDALRHEPEDRDTEYGSRQWRRDALAQVVRGSLQVTASRLLEQPLQISAGEREMDNGLRYYAEWLEDGRQRREEADRIARAAARAAKKKPALRKK